MSTNDDVYSTLVLTDDYLPGAEVVVSQLRRLDPLHPIVCLVPTNTPINANTPINSPTKGGPGNVPTNGLRPATLTRLETLFDRVIGVDVVDAGLTPELAVLRRLDLRLATTKIQLWSLPYRRVVYVDADTLPVQSLAPLFDVVLPPGGVGAAPDVGWPDTFNSGVLVLDPDLGVLSQLKTALNSRGSFDGADQGLLNETLEWVRIPFTYNVTVSTAYEYAPAFNRFRADIKLLHYIGRSKPWDSPTPLGGATLGGPLGSTQSGLGEHETWWHVYRNATLTPAFQAALQAAEAPSKPVDESKLIGPAPEHWDARVHEPFSFSKPEFAPPEPTKPTTTTTTTPPTTSAPVPVVTVTLPEEELAALALDDEYMHVFPVFGPSLVRLPFEQNQRKAERQF